MKAKLKFALLALIAIFACTELTTQATAAKRKTKAKTKQTTTAKQKNVTVYNVNGINFEMVNVKGGTFTMGATAEQGSDAEKWEKPTHKVTLSSYYIAKYEVSQALWKAVMGTNPSEFEGDNLPVENVSWNDCQEFIKRLNAFTGKKFCLPTEAEWEFACRGGNNSRGYKYSGSNNLNDVAWFKGNLSKNTYPIGTKSPNELGIYDMSGNVQEWCYDLQSFYSGTPQIDPKEYRIVSDTDRTIRGGNCYSNAQDCRSSTRCWFDQSKHSFCIGLRLAL